MANITRPGVVQKIENYRGFVITWEEPPARADRWVANVATESRDLLELMNRNGASKVIDGSTREEMIANAKKYIDELLG
jgi:hypothetical protein